MTPEYAALINGEPLPRERVDAFLQAPLGGAGPHRAAAPPRGASSHDEPAPARRRNEPPSVARQRRRWATQVVVTDELARRACADRGLKVPEEVSPVSVLAVAETAVADLGSIVAAALAHSPAARVLLAALECEQTVPETAVRDYYDRNQDRFLTPDALRRGADPFGEAAAPQDVLPYEDVREGIARELRKAAGRQAFFGWLDQARGGVTYSHGHEHPGDPSHPDHEHRH
ncbi:malonyl CoA-ACP transacylase [Streptomyces sp. TUS-ST3]|uniref:peptidyl-prolyl cis-trans isomerase n=1 Tax=Streptomyces sp. TUS-ST3 TaxID=3025591 RepID=UPI00235B4461|nr:peptidyl-prolyl cis-trans isomerase [Streptomyces sp. TUS-ST3]GLP63652.1 malonyl CoA-ACP transacylase [Streptomyces sp. TUS-ST3]